MLNDPVVIFVEESEDLSEVFGLFGQQLVEDIVLSPLDLLIVIKIIGFKELLLDLNFVQVLEMFGIGGLFDVSSALLNHLEH